jgi:hypothetical protein
VAEAPNLRTKCDSHVSTLKRIPGHIYEALPEIQQNQYSGHCPIAVTHKKRSQSKVKQSSSNIK